MSRRRRRESFRSFHREIRHVSWGSGPRRFCPSGTGSPLHVREPRWEANAAGARLTPSKLGLGEIRVNGGVPYREEVLDVRSVESYALVRGCVQGRDEGWWLYRGLAGMTKLPPPPDVSLPKLSGAIRQAVTAASSSALCSSQFRTEPSFRPLIWPELAARLSMIAPQVVLVQIDGPVDVFAGVAEVLGGRVRMEVGTVQQVGPFPSWWTLRDER